MHNKLEKLKCILRECGSVAVAFSNGVDSTFLLKVARDTLGKENVIAVSAFCEFVSTKEHEGGIKFCNENDIEFREASLNILDDEIIKKNPQNRCYFCKKTIFTEIIKIADCKKEETGRSFIVCEGSNVDDLSDYRPGLKAIEELSIKSPLREAGLTKKEIRELSKELKISTWNKPSMACFASRFVYGEELTDEKLRMVEKAEEYIRGKLDENISLRVRVHGDKPNIVARIEVPREQTNFVIEMNELPSFLHELGFSYVTMDIDGFRSGSMNEAINK